MCASESAEDVEKSVVSDVRCVFRQWWRMMFVGLVVVQLEAVVEVKLEVEVRWRESE